MFDHLISKVVLGWIRHLIGMAGAALASDGYFTADQSMQFEGALMILVPLLFSAYDKWQAQNQQNQAVLKTAAASASTASPAPMKANGTPNPQLQGLF